MDFECNEQATFAKKRIMFEITAWTGNYTAWVEMPITERLD